MKTQVHNATLKLFNVIIADKASGIDTSMLQQSGVVTDFKITNDIKNVIEDNFKPLDVNVLFSKTYYDQASSFELIVKQVLHYVEVYGLHMPGLFNLEMNEGVIITPRFIKAVNTDEVACMVRKILYSNAPVKDTDMITLLISELGIDYEINKIQNNELKIVLYRNGDVYDNGDDAVRYMCFSSTESPLLIKSKEVISAVASFDDETFLENHIDVLANVFNRHKKIIMACKSKKTRTVINAISKRSKTMHIPIRESVNKTFISLALNGQVDDKILEKVSVRDKFKYLNLLEYKLLQRDTDAFVIRNGKIHIEPNRKVYDVDKINAVKDMVIRSLYDDFAHLAGKTILLDKDVDYGLPVSRKQTIGNLPFGTTVTIEGGKISSGVYWRNEWGATDLDLSTIDHSGNRTGWGQYSGYDKNNDVSFSGDMTYADDGAMEFMTSKKSNYGLFVNIFSGNSSAEYEIVVGRNGKSNWIKDVVIREKDKLKARGSIIGFVNDNKYTLYSGALNQNLISSDSKYSSIVQRGAAKFWTVKELFSTIGIDFVVDNEDGITYDYDMSYSGFSYDKLENLMFG
jgi:hypothetical protein